MLNIVKVSGNIAGVNLNVLNRLYNVGTIKKTESILADPSHPLFNDFLLLPSGHRYSMLKCRTNRLKNKLVAAAIGLSNNSSSYMFSIH